MKDRSEELERENCVAKYAFVFYAGNQVIWLSRFLVTSSVTRDKLSNLDGLEFSFFLFFFIFLKSVFMIVVLGGTLLEFSHM
jgi:hypothetical protein